MTHQKTYDIYGFGNALLDMVYEVEHETIEALGIQKGVMTLIDEETHHKLTNMLSGHQVVYACGGSAVSSVITAHDLGAHTFCCCQVAADTAGNLYYNDLISKGTHTNLTEHNRPKNKLTGKCIVLVTPDADRTMCTFLGVTGELPPEIIDEAALADANYLYLEGYLASCDISTAGGIAARKLAEKHQVKVSMSLSDPNIIANFRSRVFDIIGDTPIDLLFCNEEEAKVFCNTNQLAVAELRLKKYAKQYVITVGNRGAIAFDGHTSFRAAAYPTKLIDTVGAGDTYAGAFMYALNRGADFELATDFSNLVASRVVSQLGPRLSANELVELRDRALEKQEVTELDLV